MMIRNQAFALICLLLSAPLSALAQVPAVDRSDGWEVASLAAAGLDPARVEELAELIRSDRLYENVHALLIEHEGALVYEQYLVGLDWHFAQPLGLVQHGPDTLHDIRSVSKSVTAILLGIALDEKPSIDLNAPIRHVLPVELMEMEAAGSLTLHHVLTMTAGLSWNETLLPYNASNDFVRMFLSPDAPAFVLSKAPVADPGTAWNYNSGLTELVALMIEEISGQPFLKFAEDRLFQPLGIEEYEWTVPPAWGDAGFPSASAALRLKAPDLAKIGSLVLNAGVWNDQQIVSASWLEQSTRRYVQDAPWGPPGVYGYGYHWFPGTLHSGHAVIRAVGWGDQRLYVLPELGLSVTLLAGNYDDGGGFLGERIVSRLVRAVEAQALLR